MSTLCILGGSGFVGTRLAVLLSRAGHTLVIPGRSKARLRPLDVLPQARTIEADIHDPAQLGHLIQGCDAVINLVGILNGSAAEFERVHAELPRQIIAACRQQGVKRILHMSALGARSNSESLYQQSKAAGEAAMRAADDLAVTVLRPSVIFGPGDNFLNLFAKLLKMSPLLPLADAAAQFQPVFVGDVAQAFVNALGNPASIGQTYDLCGPDIYTLQQLVALTAQTTGQCSHKIIPLGDTASLLMATLLGFMPGPKLMTPDNHYAAATPNVCRGENPSLIAHPTPLAVVIGYLRNEDSRSVYAGYRTLARR
jgi:NADH dehydrogenase